MVLWKKPLWEKDPNFASWSPSRLMTTWYIMTRPLVQRVLILYMMTPIQTVLRAWLTSRHGPSIISNDAMILV